ncbi:hypothetical protein L2E82_02341 [Cichorium intybus]|uniref:Uncharacterized protein n=1 Tax=Cichorium intybus TaxID=13427 RepID=A0ACB9H1X5_CICIN|nr:hypothetical protein L2E82_02341 [Cichorium intybus]
MIRYQTILRRVVHRDCLGRSLRSQQGNDSSIAFRKERFENQVSDACLPSVMPRTPLLFGLPKAQSSGISSLLPINTPELRSKECAIFMVKWSFQTQP